MVTTGQRKAPLGIRLKRSIPVYMLLLPGVVLLLLFHYLPIFGIIITFQDFTPFRGVFNSNWVGLKHFAYFLNSENFWVVMRNTVIINIYKLVFSFPFPIFFALMLNELWSNRFKKIVQSVSYLPHFVSWVVVASIVNTILAPSDGLVNAFVRMFGKEPIYFLTEKKFFRMIVVISSMWKGFGMSSVYYVSALSSIDTQLYEAAAIDGANRLQQTWHITLPGLRNIIIVLLVLEIGSIMNIGFEQIFLLYNPTVYEVGDVISTYTYRMGIESTQYSLTAAIGLSQNIVNFILVYYANLLSRKLAGWSLW